MKDKIKKILIIRLSAIGDTIHTLPLANALKRNFPDTELHWVVEDKAQFFVEQAKNVDKVYVIPKQRWKKEKNKFKVLNEFFRIINKLQHEKYDVAIDVQQLLKSGIILGLCGAKRRISQDIAREFSPLFANEIIKSKAKLFDPNYHILKHYQEYLEYFGIEDTKTTFELKDFSLSSKEYAAGLLSTIDKTKPIIILAPATTWENKHWKEENWRILFSYFAPKANIIFTGTPKDKELIKRITDGFDLPYTDISGKTTLEELAQIIKLSDLVVSPDSGTAHTAWAVEKPYIITIFTSTANKRTAPVGEKCFSFSADIPCAPCMRRKCRLKQDKNKCTASIDVKVVQDKIEELLFS